MIEDELQRVTSERDRAIERFALMCKAMNQCMWDWDIRSNVAWYSDTVYPVYGIDPSVTPSFERWTTYVLPEDRERVVGGFRAVLENGKAEWAEEYRFIRPDDGRVLEVFDRGYVMFDEGRRPVRMVGVVMDVTQQRALERQLRQAQKMQAIGQLAGGIAHDFNNMLQVASLEVELLRAAPDASERVLRHAVETARALERAATLTRQLLIFSRSEAKRVDRIDLNAKVGELATMLRRLLGENTALELQLATAPVPVEADSSMLDQVLVNLAVNARDAMPRGGTLSITTSRCGHLAPATRPSGRYVRVDVRDTGAGIPNDVLPRIFDPFFTTKTNGTGLGLATVYGIVEQHGGWIDVETELGRGTTFRVYLPECNREAMPKDRAAERPELRGTETILLVEDDVGIRTALSGLLESRGYAVLAANCGAAALGLWETAGGQIDLLVTDLMMPGMNGHELAAVLTSRRPELPTLIISGHHGRDLEPSAGSSYQLLRKPFEIENLLAAIRAALDRAQRR